MPPSSAPQKTPRAVRVLSLLLLLLVCVFAYATWLGYGWLHSLTMRVTSLESQVATTTSALQSQLAESSSTISSAIAEQAQFSNTIQNQIGSVQQQFGNISGTVSTLQKLSTLDPELLKKYSKVYFLNENYMPSALSSIPSAFTVNTSRPFSLHTQALPYLMAMLIAAQQNNLGVYVESAYRSFGEQGALKGDYAVVYGQGTANQFSADQGYSEHQLGTAVDLASDQTKGTLTGFDKTAAFSWLEENAYRFGFILSYPKNNPYYVFEPWHWRFVGVKLSTYLHDTKQNFYDVDQRQIDTFLPSIFD